VGSSQNILIPHRAYCKSGKLDGLILHFFFSLKNIPYGVNKKKKEEKTHMGGERTSQSQIRKMGWTLYL
jgi:hypothetical protein